MSMADDLLIRLREKTSGRDISANDMVALLAETLAEMPGDGTALLQGETELDASSLYREVAALAEYIQNARSEIAAMHANAIEEGKLPNATDELDAVTMATENATNEIMNCCDEISAIAGAASEPAQAKLMDAVTRIYEACSFQDTTGQRISKVVRTLKHIEGQLDTLVATFGAGNVPGIPAPAAAAAVQDDSALLNGPQLPQNATSQEDIDQLLASFDAADNGQK